MKITVTTGVRIAADYPDRYIARSFAALAPDVEIDPEQVWTAGNRVDSLAGDLASDRCATQWQKDLRRELDIAEAPSVSVGDIVVLHTDAGVYLGGWRCASCGWDVLDAEPVAGP